jgi:hypothetical protein
LTVALSYQTPGVKTTPRADFQPEHFRALIEGRGTRLSWEQGDLCPCGVYGEPSKSTCPVCRGTSWAYTATAGEVRGIVSALSLAEKSLPEFGSLGWGLVKLSLLPEHVPGFADRFTLLDGVFLRQEVAVRPATGAAQRLALPVASLTATFVQNGIAQPRTMRVRCLRPATAEGEAMAPLTEGVDFAVTADGRIDWTLGDVEDHETAPRPGEKFSISYYARPRFIVTEHPFVMRQSDSLFKRTTQEHEALPVSCLCRLDFDYRPEGSAP